QLTALGELRAEAEVALAHVEHDVDPVAGNHRLETVVAVRALEEPGLDEWGGRGATSINARSGRALDKAGRGCQGTGEEDAVAIRIETPEGTDALTEFVLFHDRVYASRPARWSAFVPLELPILAGESPFVEGRRVRPFVARAGDSIVARAAAVVDGRYHRHWGERLGHIVMFEALPETREATRLLLDAACEWLEGEGTEAARAGFGMLEFPFVIDAYDTLPPPFVRHNPAYYHALLKDAGFETEKGLVDYKIRVCPELVARWESAVEAARRSGYTLVPLRDVPASRRVAEFAELWNDTFETH